MSIFPAIALGESNLLHRDIKPDNILFFRGKAKLSDFGLVGKDVRSLSNIGTPLYIAPSWYVGKGGNPDAYGIAATLYTLISGNLPNTLGRRHTDSRKKKSPSAKENDGYTGIGAYCVLFLKIRETGMCRCKLLKRPSFRKILRAPRFTAPLIDRKIIREKYFFSLGICVLLSLALLTIFKIFLGEDAPHSLSQIKPAAYEIPNDIYINIKENGFHDGNFFIDDIKTWKDRKRSVLKAWSEDFEKSKLLAQKTEEQVLAAAEASFMEEKWSFWILFPILTRKGWRKLEPAK